MQFKSALMKYLKKWLQKRHRIQNIIVILTLLVLSRLTFHTTPSRLKVKTLLHWRLVLLDDHKLFQLVVCIVDIQDICEMTVEVTHGKTHECVSQVSYCSQEDFHAQYLLLCEWVETVSVPFKYIFCSWLLQSKMSWNCGK